MRTLAFTVFLLLSAQSFAQEIGMDLRDQNKKTVVEFFEKFSAGQAKEAFALVAPNVKWWVPESMPFGGTYDRVGYLTKVLPMFVGFQGGMKLTVMSALADGDVVAAEVESYGTHQCGEPSFIYNNKYHFRIVLKNGLFVEVKEYMDTHHLAALYAVTQTPECKLKLKP